MSDDRSKPQEPEDAPLDEVERLRLHALDQVKKFAAEAEALERFKVMKSELEKFGLKVDVTEIKAEAPRPPAKTMPWETAVTPPASKSSPTLSELMASYKQKPESPFQKIRHNSRENYSAILSLIEREHGLERVCNISALTLQQWYDAWKSGNKIAMALSKMGMLRNIFTFGFTDSGDEGCARLAGIISSMELEIPKARNEYLTLEQVLSIRAKAHEKKRYSIALAQAFQSEASFTQKDVIGEWVPLSDRSMSDVVSKGLKWVRGIRWEEIDDNLILNHFSGDKFVTADLKNCPMVMDELALLKDRTGGHLPASGPIIVSEWDNLPWTPPEFRRWWRMLADECDIPKSIRNRDSRMKRPNGAAEIKDKGGSYLD